MNTESKAKLAIKLTHALHQAPEHPEVFVNVLQQTLKSAGLHITDLAVTMGDLTSRMFEQLRAARTDAQPTFENLVDLASSKINLGRKPERILANVLRVPVKNVEDCKRQGRVPRSWFEKIRAMPNLDETQVQFDAETTRIIRLLAERGLTPEQIHGAFQRIRTSRGGLRQVVNLVHGESGELGADELARMQQALFGDRPESNNRFKIWLATHLRVPLEQVSHVQNWNNTQVERLRARFRRENGLRRDDLGYRAASLAAELVERPIRANARFGRADLAADSRRLRLTLNRLFADEAEERHTVRLSQLTGLDERHTLDLLKGANGVGQVWWDFLDAVEAELFPFQNAPLLVQRFLGSNHNEGINAGTICPYETRLSHVVGK